MGKRSRRKQRAQNKRRDRENRALNPKLVAFSHIPKDGHRVEAGNGNACPRCGKIAVRWKHGTGFRPAPGRGYFLRWDECINDACQTTQINLPEYFIEAGGPKPEEAERAFALVADLDAHFRSI